MDYRERITIEPEKRGGKPCIRGLRITVEDVLGYLASGMSEEQILADFPDLSSEDIRASIEFAESGTFEDLQAYGSGVAQSQGVVDEGDVERWIADHRARRPNADSA